ncbi:Hsp20/alpha crystallin family protein [Planctomicrobium sp. SH661]|uniref:Hsp20/alpha crystallin family protein n=1 Tax=Planctomicrobium sp. SH661 TaxID=3448124 RepID=UPI003F5C1957
MPIFRWGNPLHAFPDLEREMDRWMKSVDLAFEGLRLGRPFPALNVFATETAYLITAELPGCEPDALDIHVANGNLTLRGTRSVQGSIPEERFRRSERPSGPWERTVSLPERIDEQHIRAEFTNGLLKLHLPKLPATTPRQIKITDLNQVSANDTNPA